MENSTSPHHGGKISSQYPPATEQPEEECSVPKDCVIDLRADSFASVCRVVTENQVLQAKLAASEARVKALEAVVVKVREDKIPEYDLLKLENDGLKQRVKALEEALAPVVEWWKVEKKLEEKFGAFSDCVLGFTHKGEISHKVTSLQLDAMVKALEATK